MLDAPSRKKVIASAMRGIAKDLFDVVRWGAFVAVTRFFWVDTGSWVFGALYFILSATLFLHMSAIFLLRTDILIYRPANSFSQKAANFLVNFTICVIGFGLAMWLVELMIIGLSVQYRF